MPFIEANGERLHYRMEGSGPAVLMIHSMGIDAAMWREQFAALAGRYTCIARKPRCPTCLIKDLCEYKDKTR